VSRFSTALFLFSAAVLTVSLLALCEGLKLHTVGKAVYKTMQETAKIPEIPLDIPTFEKETDPVAEALKNTDFPALLRENPDTVAWIYIPDTEISYPVVQGKDNDFYLYHTFLRLWNNAVGAIFLDYRNNGNFADFHTIIYGHRLNRGGMFSSLNHYTETPEFYFAHPYIYLALPRGQVAKYEIFAFYEADVTENTYQLRFFSDAAKEKYIADCLGRSLLDTLVRPTASDRLLTLSTCTGHGHSHRCVVQARLKEVT